MVSALVVALWVLPAASASRVVRLWSLAWDGMDKSFAGATIYFRETVSMAPLSTFVET